MWFLGRLRPLSALGLEASPGASCGAGRALYLGRRRTWQTDPTKGPRPGGPLPPSCGSSPSAFPSSPPSSAFPAPSSPPPSVGPASLLPFLPSLPTPSLSGAGISRRRREAPSRVRAARVPGNPCGSPGDGAGRGGHPPGGAAFGAGRACAGGSAGREPRRPGSGADAAPGPR